MEIIVNKFNPYKDTKYGVIKSKAQEEKIWKKHGVRPIDDYESMKREAKYINKHREEYIRAEYKKQGLNYVPKSNTVFDEKTGRFVPRSR